MPDRSEEFISLFAANQRRIYGFVATMVPRASDVDDVFQDVSMNLWRKFDEFQWGRTSPPGHYSSPGFAVLKYYDKQSRLGRFVFDEALAELIADEAESESMRGDWRLEALRECLDRLPPPSRKLLRLRYESNLKTCREIAGRFGRSVDATYKALARIHQRLLACVQNRLMAEAEG